MTDEMKIQTMSVLVGSTACNACCPFCVSKMTPTEGIESKLSEVNWRNFDKASRYAEQNNVSTVLFTGKGEPTLFPSQITSYLEHMQKYKFPFIELQTNGMIFQQKQEEYSKHLNDWYSLGMSTIALSIVHYSDIKNKQIYSSNKEYPSLEKTIELIHEHGFSVRLSCMMIENYIDSIEEINSLVDFAKNNSVEQLTIRSIDRPKKSRNDSISAWVDKNYISEERINEIRDYLSDNATQLMVLPHGGVIYDYKGQNLCVNNCLTIDNSGKNIRQLIFFPDGHLRYDWQYEGAILL